MMSTTIEDGEKRMNEPSETQPPHSPLRLVMSRFNGADSGMQFHLSGNCDSVEHYQKVLCEVNKFLHALETPDDRPFVIV